MSEPAPCMTPQKYLATNCVTACLRKYGVTDGQLKELQFANSSADTPFRFWEVKTPLPNGAAPDLFRAYCAIKWLMLGEAPRSATREEARVYVSGVYLQVSQMQVGEMQQRQRERARKPRVKVGYDGEAIAELIRRLATRRANSDLSAKELWQRFIDELERNNLDPKHVPPDTNAGMFSCEFNFGSGTRRISFGHFANIVSKVRKKKSH